jgi:uncharacterized protein
MTKKDIVEHYIDGFRSGNSAKILKCLADDVIWRLHGCDTFTGKSAFADNISNDEFCALPLLEIRDLIQEGDRVVAIGYGAVDEKIGGRRGFNFCEIFFLKNELISEIDTFHIWST